MATIWDHPFVFKTWRIVSISDADYRVDGMKFLHVKVSPQQNMGVWKAFLLPLDSPYKTRSSPKDQRVSAFVIEHIKPAKLLKLMGVLEILHLKIVHQRSISLGNCQIRPFLRSIHRGQ
jgi:hypothetical protein